MLRFLSCQSLAVVGEGELEKLAPIGAGVLYLLEIKVRVALHGDLTHPNVFFRRIELLSATEECHYILVITD